jgi:hypothetical protein
MCVVGWEVLERWGSDVERVEALAGGVANDVWSVRIGGRLAVARLGDRSDADLAWETRLLQRSRSCRTDGADTDPDGRRAAIRRRSDRDGLRAGHTAEDLRRLASGGRHAQRVASGDAGLAAAPRLAVLARPPLRRDRHEDRPRCDAARGRCSMSRRVGAVRRSADLRRPRQPDESAQHPHHCGSGCAHRLGRVARRRGGPRPGTSPQRSRSRSR